MTNQAICPNGHIIPATSLICPICQRNLKDLELPETRVALELSAPSEGRPFCGWLVVLEGSLQGEGFHLHEGRNIIGSSPQCEIQLQDEGIEDRHASIRFSSNQWILTDLDSERGTFLLTPEERQNINVKVLECFVHLKRFVLDKDKHWKQFCVQLYEFLEKSNNRNATPLLVKITKDPEEYTRLYAVTLLGSIGDHRAIGDLQQMASSDPHRKIRRSAAKSVALIQERG